jgi:hypothetical protein
MSLPLSYISVGHWEDVMKNTSFTEVPLGAILPGRRQFIVGVTVDDDAQPLHIELPGQIVRCGAQSDFSIKPWARLISNAGSYRRAAIVTAAVADEEALDAELAGFRGRVAAKAPKSFAVRLTSNDTVGQALDALERGGGCGCDASDKSVVTIPGSLSVGLGWGANDEIWSRPVAAPIVLAWSYGPEDGVFVFDCHSVWFGWIDRSTACEGPCPKGKDCMCKDDNENWHFNCKGWRTCWCV